MRANIETGKIDNRTRSLNLRRLQCLIAIAETGTFRAAADRLHLAQPALTVHIAKLEAEVGARLLDRGRSGATLTPAGAALVERLGALAAGIGDAVAEARAVAAGQRGQLLVGFVGSAAYRLLPGVLLRAERALPGVRILLRQMVSGEGEGAVRAATLDLALTRAPSADARLASWLVLREPFAAALPAAHPGAAAADLDPASLAGERFVTLPPGSGPLRDAMVGALADAGAAVNIVDEVTEMPALLGLVAAGRGVALVPASVTELSLPGVVFRPLRGCGRRAELWLVHRRADTRRTLAEMLALFPRVERGEDGAVT